MLNNMHSNLKPIESKIVTKKCKSCGYYFITHLCRIKKGFGIYCSKECYIKKMKGRKVWNKGITHSDKTKELLRKMATGHKASKETRIKMALSHLGKKSHLWKGGITQELKHARNNLEYQIWKESVFKKYKNRCQICGLTYKKNYPVELHAHHIESFDINKELRYEVNNGVILCANCHTDFHDKYKKGNNSLTQFLKYMESRIDYDYKFSKHIWK